MSIDASPDCYLFSFIFAGLLLDSNFVLHGRETLYILSCCDVVNKSFHKKEYLWAKSSLPPPKLCKELSNTFTSDLSARRRKLFSWYFFFARNGISWAVKASKPNFSFNQHNFAVIIEGNWYLSQIPNLILYFLKNLLFP